MPKLKLGAVYPSSPGIIYLRTFCTGSGVYFAVPLVLCSGHNGQMMLEVACEAPGAVGNNRQAREMGVARASGVGRREGESRLRGLAGKVRPTAVRVHADASQFLSVAFFCTLRFHLCLISSYLIV